MVALNERREAMLTWKLVVGKQFYFLLKNLKVQKLSFLTTKIKFQLQHLIISKVRGGSTPDICCTLRQPLDVYLGHAVLLSNLNGNAWDCPEIGCTSQVRYYTRNRTIQFCILSSYISVAVLFSVFSVESLI